MERPRHPRPGRDRARQPVVVPLRPGGVKQASDIVAGRTDPLLMVITLSLLVFGLVAVYTASAHQALQETGVSVTLLAKQLVAVAIGLGVMWLASWVNFHRWMQYAKPLALASIGLLLMTMVLGVTANGSERWLPLPFGFQFQPSEVAKIAAISLMAQATCGQKLVSNTLVINLVLVGIMTLLVYQQPNLSVSMILAFMTVMMLFVAGVPLILFILLLPPVGYALFEKIKHTPYQWRRIAGWLNPWGDPQDTGYNLIQSYYAIGAGGLFGVGLGHSIQKLYYLPFQHTDFIFSVICEEMGFVGAACLMGLFVLFAWRGFAIALTCPSKFGQMLALGLTLAIILQAMINICVTIGLMPVTGVTLPLISYGGTSMVMTLGMIGILMNISRYRALAAISADADD